MHYDLGEKSQHYFKMLQQTLAKKGQTLVIVLQPPRGVIARDHVNPANAPQNFDAAKAQKNFQKQLKQFRDLGISVADLTDPPKDWDYFYIHDLHWTSAGAKWSAEKVAEEMKSLPGFDDIEKKKFASEIIPNAVLWHAGFSQFVQKACQMNIGEKPINTWATTPVGEETSQDLFGDEKFPSIALVGTSNSVIASSNFSGWLKEALQADIYNAAVIGGGFGSSITRYLASDEYLANPPKFLVWEYLAPHNSNVADSFHDFREMIPAAEGPCDEKHTLATFTSDIKGNVIDLTEFAPKTEGKLTYLTFEMNDPIERTVSLEMLYNNGEGGLIDITRNNRIANNGKYYYLLDEDPQGALTYLKIHTDKPQGHITAKLCSEKN